MAYCILLLRLMTSPPRETPHDGRFVVDYDPTWLEPPVDEGNGRYRHVKTLETTDDRRLAKRFETGAEAYAYAKMVSPNKPVRSDGLPNRPMTAYTLAIVDPDTF